MTPYTGQIYPTAFPSELGELSTVRYITEPVAVGAYLDFEVPSTKTYQLVSITSNTACWLRIYGSSYGRSVDTRVNPGAPFPAAGSGFLLEIQTSLAEPTFSPTPAVTIQVENTGTLFRIRNEGEETAPIVLTFQVVPTSYSVTASAPPYNCNICVNTQWQTDLSQAWKGCTSFTRMPFLNLDSATSLESAWEDCTNLSYVPPGLFDNSAVTNLANAFNNCALNTPSVDSILISLDEGGQANGIVDITGGTNSGPSAAGVIAAANLEVKGWTVNTEPEVGTGVVTSTYIGYALYSVASFQDGRAIAGDQNGDVYLSSDFGVTFSAVGAPIGASGPIQSLAACDIDTVIAGTWQDTNIFVSTDGGNTWSAGEDFADSEVDSIAYAGSGVVYVGTKSYIHKSLDNGITWLPPFEPKVGGTDYYVSIAFPGPNEIVASTYENQYIAYSSDGGDTWSYTADNIFGSNDPVYALASDGAGIVLAGNSGEGRVFRSTDSGATWDSGVSLGAAFISYLVYAEDGAFYAGTFYEGKIFRSLDAGLTWEEFFNPVLSAGGGVYSLAPGGASNLIAGIGPDTSYSIPYNAAPVPVPTGGLQVYPNLSSNVQSLPYVVPGTSVSPVWNIVSLTQADYDALVFTDPTTLYVIVS